MSYSYGGGGGYGGGQNQYGNTSYGGGGGYSKPSYGAQGPEGGGGFMGGSQGASQDNKSGPDKETLRPLTIMQTNAAAEPYAGADYFKIDDSDVKTVSVVGQVRNISKQELYITYKLDDGTATTEVKAWLHNDNQDGDGSGAAGASKVEEGMWARVYGRLKSYNDRVVITALKVRPVTDHDEVTYHMLEAAYVHLYMTRGPPEQFHGGGAGANGAMQGLEGQAQNGGMIDLASGRGMPNMSAAAKKVWNTLHNTPQGNEGLHVQQITHHSGLSMAEVMKGGDELMNHSLIFTTVDDNTWALLES